MNFHKKKPLQSLALNLQSFEDFSASENELKMKTKMDLWIKTFEASKISKASLQHCYCYGVTLRVKGLTSNS